MGTPRDFESLAKSLASDISKDVLSSKCSWTSVIGIERASKSQQLTAMILESYALDRALMASDDIDEDCKNAFALGFFARSRTIINEKRTSTSGFP